jgi:hypothetical protein
LHKPDATLSGTGVFPDEAGIAIPAEVRGACDVPLNRNRRQVDTAGMNAVFEEPNATLTGAGVFPDEVIVAVAVEVLEGVRSVGAVKWC